jgi:type VI secretion system protein ImpH
VNQPERLTRYVADVIGAPVALREFVGEWLEIPARLQSRLGRGHCGLGQSAVIGGRSFQRQGRAELRVGPIGLLAYLAIASNPGLRRRVARAIRFASGCGIDYDLRPILARAAIPDPRLGTCRLGLSTWISPRRSRDADDLRLARITAAPSGQEDLAA